jgi:AAA lid domain
MNRWQHLPTDFWFAFFVESIDDPQLETLLESGWKLDHSKFLELASMNDIDALAEVAQKADLSPIRPQLARLLRILRSAGIVLSDRRVVKAQSLIAAAAVVSGRSRPSDSDLWPLIYVVPTQEQQEIARESLCDLLRHTENATLPAAAEEASAGPLVRGRRLVSSANELLATSPDGDANMAQSWRLKLEGVVREIDASFTAEAMPPDQSPQTQTLARLAARAILRDAGQGLQSLGPIPLRQLIDYSGDGALRADVPPRSPGRKVEINDLGAARQYSVAANDRGSTQISEAVLLPNGTCAVALGEVGLKLITRDGRTIAHFDEPADRVVVSDGGGKFITMAHRGSVWCLSRVDVQSRRIAPWCHAEISRFTTTFDGATWHMASGQDLYAIDATSKRLDALWRIPDLGHFVGPFTLASTKLEFVTYKDKNFWFWEYQLPQLRLKNKTLLPFSRPLRHS